eukprot:GILJ01006506.1.p1 GENE.GILJ01006506.1~~GILJ01006506.1.p1  ORF type:complete len:861 (-),score=137.54 GILJ01006506.1:229-2616(-)
MTAKFPQSPMPHFPSRITIPLFFSPHSVDKRRLGIQTYLRHLLDLCKLTFDGGLHQMHQEILSFLTDQEYEKHTSDDEKFPSRKVSEEFVDTEAQVATGATGATVMNRNVPTISITDPQDRGEEHRPRHKMTGWRAWSTTVRREGTLFVREEKHKDWQLRAIVLTAQELFVFTESSAMLSNANVVVCLVGSTASMQRQIYGKNHVIQVRIVNDTNSLLLSSEDEKELEGWWIALQETEAESAVRCPLSTRVLGKISANVKAGNALSLNVQEPLNAFLKLQLGPFSFRTRTCWATDTPVWNQKFIIPIVNRFSELKFELMHEDVARKKEDCIATGAIPVTDIQKAGTEDVWIQLHPSSHKKRLTQGGSIRIILSDHTNFMKHFAPQDMLFEGDGNEDELHIQTLKVNLRRAKRLWCLLLRTIAYFNFLVRWENLKLSSVFIFSYTVFCLLFDFSYLPSLLLFLLSSLLLLHHPDIHERLTEFEEEKLHMRGPYSLDHPMTRSQSERERSSQLHYILTVPPDKRGLMDKYKKYKNSVLKLQQRLGRICTVLEKIKNLLNWTDPPKTLLLVCAMLSTAIVALVVSFRFQILLVGWIFFFLGYRRKKRRMANNIHVCNQVITELLQEFIPDGGHLADLEPLHYKLDATQQTKFRRSLRKRLSLDIEEDVLIVYPSIQQLVTFLAHATVFMSAATTDAEKQTVATRKHKPFKNFIANVPSDAYLAYCHQFRVDTYRDLPPPPLPPSLASQGVSIFPTGLNGSPRLKQRMSTIQVIRNSIWRGTMAAGAGSGVDQVVPPPS